VFFRLSPGWIRESRRLDSPFGSDHRPIVVMMRQQDEGEIREPPLQ
jgi:hypothetical protein